MAEVRDLVEDEVDDIMKTLKEKHVDMAIYPNCGFGHD